MCANWLTCRWAVDSLGNGSWCGVGAAPWLRNTSAGRRGLRAPDGCEGLLLGLVPVSELAPEHVLLCTRGRALDLLGVLVDADHDQRRLPRLEHRADALGISAAGPVGEVPEPRAESGARPGHAGVTDRGQQEGEDDGHARPSRETDPRALLRRLFGLGDLHAVRRRVDDDRRVI